MVKFLNEKTDLTRISSVLSLFTLVAFHWPFFRLVLGNIEGGFNGVLITGGLGVLMFAVIELIERLVIPWHSSFRNAPAVYEGLFSRGIVVCRPADGLFQKGYLRITIGSKSANNALLSALRQF